MQNITYFPRFTHKLDLKLREIEAKRREEETDDFIGTNEIRMSLNTYLKSKKIDKLESVSSANTYFTKPFVDEIQKIDVFFQRIKRLKDKKMIFRFKEPRYPRNEVWEISPFVQPVRRIDIDIRKKVILRTVNHENKTPESLKKISQDYVSCLLDLPSSLNKDAPRLGHSNVAIYDEKLQAFEFEEKSFIKLFIGDEVITWDKIEGIQNNIEREYERKLSKPFNVIKKFLKKVMRRWKLNKTSNIDRLEKYLRKDNVLDLKLLSIFKRFKQNVREKKINIERKDKTEQQNISNITFEKMSKLIDAYKKEDLDNLIEDLKEQKESNDFINLRVKHFKQSGTLFEQHISKFEKMKKRLRSKAINLTSRLHVNIAESREGFVKNNCFLEREKWFGFTRNGQLINMMNHLSLDFELLRIDWGSSVLPENSKRIKLALSSLCSLTKTKQYIAFCNMTNSVEYDENIFNKMKDNKGCNTKMIKMFCTIFGFDDWSFEEFKRHLFNHYSCLSDSNGMKGLNWATKYCNKLYDMYVTFRELVPEENLIVRQSKDNRNKVRTDGSCLYSDLFLQKPKSSREVTYARSFDAGVYKYVKEAMHLIKNRGKTLLKKWNEFCDANDIYYHSDFSIEPRTIYDKVSEELVKDKIKHQINFAWMRS